MALVGAVLPLPGLISWLTSTLSTKEKLFLFQVLLEASSSLSLSLLFLLAPTPSVLQPSTPTLLMRCKPSVSAPDPASCLGDSLAATLPPPTIDHTECLWQGTDLKVPSPKTVTVAKNTDLKLCLDLSCRQAEQRDVSE